MSIETRNNTDTCGLSTPIRVASVFAKRRRRGYRKWIEPHRINLQTLDRELENIAGAAVKRERQTTGLSRPQFGALFDPPVIPDTLRKIEEYIPGVANKQTIKAGPIKLRVCAKLGLLPTNVSDMSIMTKGSQEPDRQAGRGDPLPLFRPRLAEGGSMSVPSPKAQSTIDRPTYITGPSDWALEMVGDTMWPEFRDGATLFVNPTATPEPGMGCVFLNPDRTKFRVLAYVGNTTEEWQAEQWYPRESVTLPIAEWPYCEPIEAVHAPHKRGIQK